MYNGTTLKILGTSVKQWVRTIIIKIQIKTVEAFLDTFAKCLTQNLPIIHCDGIMNKDRNELV